MINILISLVTDRKSPILSVNYIYNKYNITVLSNNKLSSVEFSSGTFNRGQLDLIDIKIKSNIITLRLPEMRYVFNDGSTYGWRNIDSIDNMYYVNFGGGDMSEIIKSVLITNPLYIINHVGSYHCAVNTDHGCILICSRNPITVDTLNTSGFTKYIIDQYEIRVTSTFVLITEGDSIIKHIKF